MRISKKGITFNYNNDEITWIWWWARQYSLAFYSLIYAFSFKSFKEYWQHVGRHDKPLGVAKIKGYSLQALVYAWARLHCRSGHYVLLFDINVEAKPATFWRSIPDRDKKELLQDLVVLNCKDENEIQSLCDSISRDFATAIGIRDGHVVYWNEEETTT